MSTNRLNGIIRAWEQGKPAFTAFAKLDKQTAIEMSDAPYDGIVFEMEHNPYDVSALGDSLQYMLNRKQIAESGSVAPGVTPLARIPANGVEMNQSFAKQVLDRGVYGVITPHVATVEQAYNAVASCRYARPKNAPLYEPKGVRGDGPATAARYWGLSQAGILRQGRRLAAGAAGRNPGRPDDREHPGDREPGRHAGQRAGHRLRA
jgi:4-hydroxy-2-oxoheptanedioate aldolase